MVMLGLWLMLEGSASGRNLVSTPRAGQNLQLELGILKPQQAICILATTPLVATVLILSSFNSALPS